MYVCMYVCMQSICHFRQFSTEHGKNVQYLTLPEESPECMKVLLLAIKVNNAKLETTFAEGKKASDS